MASVATGSVAAMIEPTTMQSTNDKFKLLAARVKPYIIPASIKAVITVPKIAYVRILPIFLNKLAL